MSRFSKSQKGAEGNLANMVQPLEQLIKSQGADLVGESLKNHVVGVESIVDAATADNVSNDFEDVSAKIRNEFANEGIELSDAQVEAGAIATVAATSDPLAYHGAATVGVESASFPADVKAVEMATSGAHGSIISGTTVGVEAFEERELRAAAASSAVYNIASATQDAFGEAFYRTVVLAPDQVGLRMKVTATVVHEEIRRTAGGKVTEFKKHNLIEAPVDHTILENRATDVVPYINPDNSSDHLFVDKTLVAPYETVVNGVPVRTAPLAFGTTFDLLGLSQAPGLMNGQVFDSTDILDSRVAVKALYVKVAAKDDSATAAVKVNTQNLPRSTFNKSTEGGSHEMELNFRTDVVYLSENTTDIGGVKVMNQFGDLANYRLYFKTVVTGSTDLETSETSLSNTKLALDYVTLADEAGTPVALSDAALTAALNLVTISLVGFDPEAYRTNSNLRTRSMMLDTRTVEEGYKVHLGAPITIPAPLIGPGRSGVDVKSLIAATRTINGNDSVTAILNFLERLKARRDAIVEGRPAPAVEGIARHLVRPTYIEDTLDILKLVDSQKSSEKAEDIQAAIVESLRHTVYKMIVESNYQIALDFDTAGSNAKPKVIIGTDPITARYIYESGDGRTLATGIDEVDFEIVTTNDARMKNKIVIGLTRTGGSEDDPLAFGVHAYVPELIATVEVTRNGSAVKENQVQRRNVHINNVPVAGLITIENLKEALGGKIPQKTTNK